MGRLDPNSLAMPDGSSRPEPATGRRALVADAASKPGGTLRRRGCPSRRAAAAFGGMALAVGLLGGLAGVRPGPALANGVGDLYAATADGVGEILVASEEVLATVPLQPPPTALAFAPDGRTLFAVAGSRSLQPIDIEALSTIAAVPLPGAAVNVAHPKGERVVVALAGDRRLAIVDPSSGSVARSGELPGPPDLLAADRRHEQVAVAENGKSWFGLLDGESPPRTVTVEGRVTAIAVSSDGAAYVAIRAPASVRRISLRDLAVERVVTLPASPDAIAVLADGVVVASGRTLWWLDRTGPRQWRTTQAPVTSLAASDDGQVLYAATGGAIEAFVPRGNGSARITLEVGLGPAVLAPAPRPASLTGLGGSGVPGNTPGEAGRAPATNTERAATGAALDPLPIVLVVLVVLFVAGIGVRRIVGVRSD